MRAVSGTQRREVYQTGDGGRFKASDNAPAWWVHAALLQGFAIAPPAFADIMTTLPTHMFDIARTSAPTANAAGWHIAHIFPVKDGRTNYHAWTTFDLVRRCVRNFHPCNYFLVPTVEWHRWGGDAAVISYFIDVYRERYSSVWTEFAELADADRQSGATSVTPVGFAFGLSDAETGGHKDKGASAVQRRGRASAAAAPAAEYSATRLLFRRDVIEALDPDEAFRVVTPVGVFQMTKAEFYSAFPRVPVTKSYTDAGVYHYPSVPRAAERFRVDD